jgi:hypothetical protein
MAGEFAVLQCKRAVIHTTPAKEKTMSSMTWTNYVSMEEGMPEPGMLDGALDGLEDWEDDLDLGDLSLDASPADLDEDFGD